MPTTRKRRGHGLGLTEEIIATLGMGMGVNHVPDDELRALWQTHGAAVTAYWQQKYGHDPFVAMIARQEGW